MLRRLGSGRVAIQMSSVLMTNDDVVKTAANKEFLFEKIRTNKKEQSNCTVRVPPECENSFIEVFIQNFPRNSDCVLVFVKG